MTFLFLSLKVSFFFLFIFMWGFKIWCSKVSFKILHTLWVYRLSIYPLIYEIKIVTNIRIDFKIWCQVGVWIKIFKFTAGRWLFYFWSKKLTDTSHKRSLWVIFWKFQKFVHKLLLHLIPANLWNQILENSRT